MSDFQKWSVLAFRAMDDAGRVLMTIEPESTTEGERLDQLKETIRELLTQALVLNGVCTRRQLDERFQFGKLDTDALNVQLGQQQAEPVAWTSVIETLPESGVKVLACYRNGLGNLRCIRAMWTAAKTEEANPDDFNEEYDEATDTYYVPEGWYECIDNWVNYSSVAVTEGEVTHWMPLPQPPIKAAHNIQEPKP